MKFDRTLWNEKSDMDYPYRKFMVEDLVKHHKLVGLTYKELTIQIGQPARFDNDKDNPYYEITTDYGSDIDPIYTKCLAIKLNKDSVVTECKIEEWKKNE